MDSLIGETVRAYNARLKPSVPLDADWVRAMIVCARALELPPAARDVLQAGKEHSDLVTTAELRRKLALGMPGRLDLRTKIEACVAWLFHLAARYGEKTFETGLEMTYVVREGETLDKLARKLETTPATLRRYSRLQTDVLKAGQVLRYREAVERWVIAGWSHWANAIKKYGWGQERYDGRGDPAYYVKVKTEYSRIKSEMN
jgi:hypothetical protein